MARYFHRRKFCRFTADNVVEIDYKDVATLKNYITESGKIVQAVLRYSCEVSTSISSCDQARSLPCAASILTLISNLRRNGNASNSFR